MKLHVLIFLMFFQSVTVLFSANAEKTPNETQLNFCRNEKKVCSELLEKNYKELSSASYILDCDEVSFHSTKFREHLELDKQQAILNRGESGKIQTDGKNLPFVLGMFTKHLVQFRTDNGISSSFDCSLGRHKFLNQKGGLAFLGTYNEGWGKPSDSLYTIYIFPLRTKEKKYIAISSDVSESYTKSNDREKFVSMIAASNQANYCSEISIKKVKDIFRGIEETFYQECMK